MSKMISSSTITSPQPYVQPQQPMMGPGMVAPTVVHADGGDIEVPDVKGEGPGGIIRDAYAALRQRGPLVEVC